MISHVKSEFKKHRDKARFVNDPNFNTKNIELYLKSSL